MVRRGIVAGLVLTSLAAGAVGGHLLPHAGPPQTQVRACQTEDDPGPCHWDAAHQGNGRGHSFSVGADGNATPDPWHLLTKEEAYAAYLPAYQGCPEDFVAVYLGTRFRTDLPQSTQDEIDWIEDQHLGDPVLVDFGPGSAVVAPADREQVVILDAYSGACKN